MFFGGLLIGIFALVLVICIHEAGHAFIAWLLQIRIQRISLGFGKPLFLWRDNRGCEWVIAKWPFGGYVKLLNSRIEYVNVAHWHECFDKKPIWQRCLVLVAGGLANLWLAWCAFLLMFIIGFWQTVPVIKTVTPNTIASQANLAAGDRIVAINHHRTNSWVDVGMQLLMGFGRHDIRVEVLNLFDKDVNSKQRLALSCATLNANSRCSLVLQTRYVDLSKWPTTSSKNLLGLIGIEPDPNNIYKQWIHAHGGQAAVRALQRLFNLVGFFLSLLKQLAIGAIPFSILLGPLSFLLIAIDSLRQGLVVCLNFLGSLSLTIGLVNLLPLPSFDGGAVIYAVVEKIFHKPISLRLEILLYRLTLIGLSLLIVQLILHDLRGIASNPRLSSLS